MVETSPGCRDINCEDLRSRHHLDVATSIVKTGGLDIIKQSRQQKQGTKVATSFRGRDVNSSIKEVATSSRGRDIHCTDQKVATSVKGRDISYTEKRSRQDQAVATSAPSETTNVATKQGLLRQRLRQQRSRQGIDVATSTTKWAS